MTLASITKLEDNRETMKPVMSVVIGTFNLQDKLALVLDSFNKQTLDPQQFEVIVVDSQSTDETSVMIGKFHSKYKLRYIIQENKGKTAARNTGIKEAKSDLLLITDADMIAHPDLLAQHLKLQEKYKKEVVIEGNTMVLTQESLPAEDFIRRPYITHKVENEQQLGFYYCLSGNLCIPKKMLLNYGMFDESYSSYGWEDIDLGYRLLNQAGKKLIFAQKALNYHFHVWTELAELQRRQKMGESVHILLNKFPQLKHFTGVHLLNKLLYNFFSKNENIIQNWLNDITNNSKVSRFKKLILREYYYQKGYNLANIHC